MIESGKVPAPDSNPCVEIPSPELLPRPSVISPDAYQRLCSRTECNQEAARQRFNAGGPETGLLEIVRLNHAVIGLAGEVGELASLVEKHVHYGQDLDRVAFAEELGDVMWYVALACNALGVSLAAVMEANLAKLRARYPEKYSDERAAESNRDRGAEKQAMADVRASGPPISTEGGSSSPTDMVRVAGEVGESVVAGRDPRKAREMVRRNLATHDWTGLNPNRCKRCGAYRNLSSGQLHECPGGETNAATE